MMKELSEAMEPGGEAANPELREWVDQFAATVTRLTGAQPTVHWGPRLQRRSAKADLWWELGNGSPNAKFHVGAGNPTWQALAANVLRATPSLESYIDKKQVYVNLLDQSSEQKGLVSGSVPACDHFEVVELQFPGQEAIQLLLGIPSVLSPAADSSLGVLSHVELPMTVRFGSTRMFLEDLIGLSMGNVVEFDHAPDDAVEILVNDRVVARGEAVVVHGNYGIRITEVVSRRERLNASHRIVQQN